MWFYVLDFLWCLCAGSDATKATVCTNFCPFNHCIDPYLDNVFVNHPNWQWQLPSHWKTLLKFECEKFSEKNNYFLFACKHTSHMCVCFPKTSNFIQLLFSMFHLKLLHRHKKFSSWTHWNFCLAGKLRILLREMTFWN